MSIFLFSLATLSMNINTTDIVDAENYSIVYDAYYPPVEVEQSARHSEPLFRKTPQPKDIKKHFKKSNYLDIQVLFECRVLLSGNLDKCAIREISPDNDKSRQSVSVLTKYFVLKRTNNSAVKLTDSNIFIAASVRGLGEIVPAEVPCIAPLCSITPPPVPAN